MLTIELIRQMSNIICYLRKVKRSSNSFFTSHVWREEATPFSLIYSSVSKPEVEPSRTLDLGRLPVFDLLFLTQPIPHTFFLLVPPDIV